MVGWSEGSCPIAAISVSDIYFTEAELNVFANIKPHVTKTGKTIRECQPVSTVGAKIFLKPNAVAKYLT